MKSKSTVFWIRVVGLALAVVGIQIVLAWNLCSPSNDKIDPGRQYPRFLSGTICEGELIFLMDTLPKSEVINWSNDETFAVDEVHCDLRTGSISTSPALPGVRHVVSDGQTLWRLPAVDRFHHPFVWRGRPVDVANSSQGNPMLEFEAGTWKETEEYLLMPFGYPGFPTTSPPRGSTSISMLSYIWNEPNVYYNVGVSVGTRQQAIEFNRRIPHDRDRLLAAGWQQTSFDQAAFRITHRPSDLDDAVIGVWIENSQVCALKGIIEVDRIAAFEFHWSAANERVETNKVRSPIRWGTQGDSFVSSASLNYNGWIKTVTTTPGDVFIISFDGDDGRLHVLKWKNRRLRLVAQRGSPLIVQECRAVERVARYTILIPSLVLGLLAWIIQRIEGRHEFFDGNNRVRLASVARRGIARFIDVSIPVTVLLASVVLHPDVTGWWFEVKSKWSQLVSRFNAGPTPVLSSFGGFGTTLGEFYWELISVPSLAWPFIVAILLLAAQTIWQGRTGQTLGKWICGVKVLRTTLRPCGLARSLLREILLVIDSVLLICWIPGVVSILATRHSQRIGDLLADTIVVRDRSRHESFDEPAGIH